MQTYESLLIWSSVALYALTTALLLVAFVFNKERILDRLVFLLVPAFIAHTIVFAIRWQLTGYFPANGEYENGVTSGWFAVLLTLYLFFRRKGYRGAALFTIPATLLFLGYGLMIDPEHQPLGAALKSTWLVIHVAFAHLAFGAYVVASGLGLVYLLKDRKERQGKAVAGTIYGRFPALPLIDEMMFKFVVFGFIADAIMIAAGMIWAKDLWGSYWSWDPIEVWSLVSWLIYGLAIHLRVTLGWRGRRLAWILLFAIIGIIITFWGVDLVVSNAMHAFGVGGRGR